MNRTAFVGRTDTGDPIERLTPTGAGGLGWLARALMLSLSCLVTNCGDDGNTTTSSGGSGGASMNTGGATSSGGSASGGADASGGVASGSGGAAAGSDGTSGFASGGGTAPTGGAGGSKTGGAGGNATGGARSSGGTSAGGSAGSGGSTDGGTSTGGNGDGGATTGGSSDGGATTGGTGDGGPSTGGSSDGTGGTTDGPFMVTSPGWDNIEGCSKEAAMTCAPVPTAMTRPTSGGSNTSPELTWTHAPEGTKSFAILFQDLSGPSIHWVLWNIPATVTMLPVGIDPSTAAPAEPAGSQQCSKDPQGDGYYGPGAPCNVYELIVYALSIETFSPTTPTDEKAVAPQLQALGDGILGTAAIRGRTDTDCSQYD